MEINEFRQLASAIVTDGGTGYDAKVRRLAALAQSALPGPLVSDACQKALDERLICDMYEGNAPYTPRYVLPDYEKALSQGLRYLELDPPQDLDDALSFLTIMYGHVPSVTTYPVYVGDLDKLLLRFVPDSMSDDELDARLRRFWRQLDRLLPDGFVHTNLGPADNRIIRSIFRIERELKQIVPNITLKVQPGVTPDDLVRDAVETVFATGKPHFVNHPMMVRDHGEQYAAVSCYNSLKIGGGSHNLTRLNLRESALRHEGSVEDYLATTLPGHVELTAELMEARTRSLVEHQRFFEIHWLATEGLVDIDRFSAMFGIFSLAECVAILMERNDIRNEAGEIARYGHDDVANQAAYRIVERIHELVLLREQPYCGGGNGRAYLHSQGGIDTDAGTTAGTRIPVGDEPGMREHIMVCAPHHTHCEAGISDIFHVDETATRNPEAMVDIIKGAFEVGMRDFTFNLDSNEFVRITGYLVRKSDLEAINASEAARHGSDYFAAGSENEFHLTQRAVKRVGVVEMSPNPRG